MEGGLYGAIGAVVTSPVEVGLACALESVTIQLPYIEERTVRATTMRLTPVVQRSICVQVRINGRFLLQCIKF